MEIQIKRIGDFSEPLFRAALHKYGYVISGAIKVANQQSVCVEDLAERGVAYR